MASKRRIRRKQIQNGCQNKKRYDDQETARKACGATVRWAREKGVLRPGFLRPYACKFCGGWHIGRSKGATSMVKFIEKVV